LPPCAETSAPERSPLPGGGSRGRPTPQPICLDLWQPAAPPGTAYTTVGTWGARGRDLTFRGGVFRWRKRTEWLRCLDLPTRTGARFEVAMDVAKVPGDPEILRAHGWGIED